MESSVFQCAPATLSFSVFLGPGLTLMQHMAHGRTTSLPPSLSHMKARVVGVRLFILQLLHDVSLLPILESFSGYL